MAAVCYSTSQTLKHNYPQTLKNDYSKEDYEIKVLPLPLVAVMDSVVEFDPPSSRCGERPKPASQVACPSAVTPSAEEQAWLDDYIEAHQTTKELDIAMMKEDNVGLDIDLEKTWKGLAMVARAIAAIENPEDILVASDSMMINKDIDVPDMVQYFVDETGTRAFTRTCYICRSLPAHLMPRLLIITYPKTEDHLHLIEEASFAKIPMIVFCEIDCPMEFVNGATIIIPADCNESAISCLFWLLGRMVLQIRGLIPQGHPWERFEDPDLCYWVIEDCEEEDYKGRTGGGKRLRQSEETC